MAGGMMVLVEASSMETDKGDLNMESKSVVDIVDRNVQESVNLILPRWLKSFFCNPSDRVNTYGCPSHDRNYGGLVMA